MFNLTYDQHEKLIKGLTIYCSQYENLNTLNKKNSVTEKTLILNRLIKIFELAPLFSKNYHGKKPSWTEIKAITELNFTEMDQVISILRKKEFKNVLENQERYYISPGKRYTFRIYPITEKPQFIDRHTLEIWNNNNTKIRDVIDTLDEDNRLKGIQICHTMLKNVEK